MYSVFYISLLPVHKWLLSLRFCWYHNSSFRWQVDRISNCVSPVRYHVEPHATSGNLMSTVDQPLASSSQLNSPDASVISDSHNSKEKLATDFLISRPPRSESNLQMKALSADKRAAGYFVDPKNVSRGRLKWVISIGWPSRLRVLDQVGFCQQVTFLLYLHLFHCQLMTSLGVRFSKESWVAEFSARIIIEQRKCYCYKFSCRSDRWTIYFCLLLNCRNGDCRFRQESLLVRIGLLKSEACVCPKISCSGRWYTPVSVPEASKLQKPKKSLTSAAVFFSCSAYLQCKIQKW